MNSQSLKTTDFFILGNTGIFLLLHRGLSNRNFYSIFPRNCTNRGAVRKQFES